MPAGRSDAEPGQRQRRIGLDAAAIEKELAEQLRGGLPLTDATSANSVRKPVSVDRDNFYGLSSRDYRESTTDAGTVKLEHDLNDSLTLSNTTRVVRTTLDYIVTTPNDSKAGNLPNGLVYRSAKSP